MTFGEKLVNLRKSNDLSQDQLAASLGVARNTLVRWESDTIIPSAESVSRICEFFNVKIEQLFDYKITSISAGVKGGKAAATEPVTEIHESVKSRIKFTARQEITILIYAVLIAMLVVADIVIGIITLPMLGKEEGANAVFSDGLDPGHFFILFGMTIIIIALFVAEIYWFIKENKERDENEKQ